MDNDAEDRKTKFVPKYSYEIIDRLPEIGSGYTLICYEDGAVIDREEFPADDADDDLINAENIAYYYAELAGEEWLKTEAQTMMDKPFWCQRCHFDGLGYELIDGECCPSCRLVL